MSVRWSYQMSDTTVHRNQFPAEAPMEERRRSRRTRMVDLVYLKMAPENGGILLDVSFTGLAFEAADPIATEAQTHFQLSAGWIDDIELSGDLIWLDETRKKGGLRFGQLPEAVRKQIQEWVRKPDGPSPQVRQSGPVVSDRVIQPSAAAGHSFVGDKTSPSSPRRNQPDSGSAGPATAPVLGPPRFSPDPTPPVGAPHPAHPLSQWGSIGVHAPEECEDASRRKRRLGAIALAVAVILLVAALGVFAFLNKREADKSPIGLGEGLAGEDAQQRAKAEASATPSSVDTPAPESALSANPPGANAPPSNVSRDPTEPAPAGSHALGSTSTADKTQQLAEARQADPKPHAGGTVASGASSSSAQSARENSSMESANPSSEAFPAEDDGRKELALARQYLRGTGVTQDRATAAHLLWVAVGLGNTQAELELADLYLQGEGAPGKNCEQARILLTAAANSGNPGAGQKLAGLQDYGCR
jgi:hypothetical protein